MNYDAGVHGPGQSEWLAAGARRSWSVQVKYPVDCHRNVAFSGSRVKKAPDLRSRRIRIRNSAATEMLLLLFSHQILHSVQFYVLIFICTPDSCTIHFFLVVILFWYTLLACVQQWTTFLPQEPVYRTFTKLSLFRTPRRCLNTFQPQKDLTLANGNPCLCV